MPEFLPVALTPPIEADTVGGTHTDPGDHFKESPKRPS